MTSSTERRGRHFAWAVDHPAAAAVLLGVLALATAWLLPRAHIDFSLEQLYPQDSDLAVFYKDHQDVFGPDDDLIFAARPGRPFDPALAQVEAVMAAHPGVLSTRSPHSVEKLEDEDGLLRMRPLVPGEADVLTRGTVLAMDGQAGAVLLRLSQTHNQHEGREAVMTALEQATAEAGGTWHLAGTPVIRTAYVRLILSDLARLVPLAILISAGFFISSFRDWRQVVLGVVGIASGSAVAAAAYVASGGIVNTFTPAFMAVVIVVGTSDLVHLIHRFNDHLARMDTGTGPPDTREAARRAAAEVGTACLLTTSTTAVGFLALLSTDLPTIRMFGLGTGMGVVLTYIVAFLLVPPVLARIRPPTAKAQQHARRRSDRMARLGRWVMARHRRMLAGAAVVAVALVGLSTQVTVGHRILADLGPTQAGQAQAFMEAHMGAVLPLQVDLQFQGDARDPAAMAAVDHLTRWMRDQSLVGHALSLADLARESWSTLSGDAGALPPSQPAAAQALLALELGKEDPVPRFLTADGSRTRIVARVYDEGGQATVDLVEAIEAKAGPLLSAVGGTATVTGAAYLIQSINRTLTTQFAGSFLIALLLIGLAWLLTTRSLRRVAVALIPNILPLLAVLATMGALGIPLKPTTAMVFSIGLGIAVDDTIHFLAAYTHRRQQAGTSAEAIDYAYRTAGRSMLDTSVVLAAGFCSVAASEFQGFWLLGMLTAWSVVVALATDLLVMGPLLRVLDR